MYNSFKIPDAEYRILAEAKIPMNVDDFYTDGSYPNISTSNKYMAY